MYQEIRKNKKKIRKRLQFCLFFSIFALTNNY
jgi:LytS/YehU family sensor histidine kinase